MADDAPAPAIAGQLFVLVQVLPRFEILATSYDRERLRSEAKVMADQIRQIRKHALHRWYVRPTTLHLT